MGNGGKPGEVVALMSLGRGGCAVCNAIESQAESGKKVKQLRYGVPDSDLKDSMRISDSTQERDSDGDGVPKAGGRPSSVERCRSRPFRTRQAL